MPLFGRKKSLGERVHKLVERNEVKRLQVRREQPAYAAGGALCGHGLGGADRWPPAWGRTCW